MSTTIKSHQTYSFWNGWINTFELNFPAVEFWSIELKLRSFLFRLAKFLVRYQFKDVVCPLQDLHPPIWLINYTKKRLEMEKSGEGGHNYCSFEENIIKICNNNFVVVFNLANLNIWPQIQWVHSLGISLLLYITYFYKFICSYICVIKQDKWGEYN